MNIQAIKADGEYCPIESYANGGPWVPAEDTNVAHVFAREIAKMRSPYYESSYDETDRDHHLAFANGFK